MEDPILFWNHLCNEANKFDHTAPMQGASQGGPTRSSRATAIVHLAMHDAFFGVFGAIGVPGGHNLYLPGIAQFAPNNTTTQSAAVSSAAHTVLSTLYPHQAAKFDSGALDIVVANGTDELAHEYGRKIALKLLALRAGDGSNSVPFPSAYVYSHAKPRHRSDPLNAQPEPLGANWGHVKFFAAQMHHAMADYPVYRGNKYNDDHEEVRVKGGAASQASVTRTPEETAIGLYWAYDGATKLGTPPRLYNQIARVIAKDRNNSWADNARMFGLLNVAMGDAGILAWHHKYVFDLWRPVIGIREYDNNWGADSLAGQAIDPKCDPFWRPLGAPKTNDIGPGIRSFTPPFPAYPSGHATFGAAAFESIRQFYRVRDGLAFTDKQKDAIEFSFVSDELNGFSQDSDTAVRTLHRRKYKSLADAIYDNSISRIYLGVHWRFDGTAHNSAASMMAGNNTIGGVPLGLAIARDIFASDLKITPDGIGTPQ